MELKRKNSLLREKLSQYDGFSKNAIGYVLRDWTKVHVDVSVIEYPEREVVVYADTEIRAREKGLLLSKCVEAIKKDFLSYK